MDDQTRIEIEAAAFRRLRKHLIEDRPDAQNIDMMNLAGFCRNCLSRWYQEAAAEHGIEMTKDAARETYYGMPMSEWKAKHQTEATAEQQAVVGFTRGVFGHLDAVFRRGFLVPARQAVAAKASEVHHVDVLRVWAVFD